MGWAMIAMQAASNIAQGIGAKMEGDAAATASRYQAAVADNNAAIARNNALMASRIGDSKATQQELKNRAQMGAIVASQAANGVDVNTGTAKSVQDSAHILGRMDTETIKSDAAREAHAYQTQAAGFESDKKLLKMKAKQQKKMGNYALITSLLGAGGQGASSYMQAYGGQGGGNQPTQLPGSKMTGANVVDTSYMSTQDVNEIY